MMKPLLWQQDIRTPIGSGCFLLFGCIVNLFLTVIL